MSDAAYSDYRDSYYYSGSTLYYSCLMLNDATREQIISLHGFYHEISQIVETTREPSVAATRLEWWANEIENWFNGKPRHPISTEIMRWLPHANHEPDSYQNILAALTRRLTPWPFASDQEWQAYCHDSRAQLCSLLFALENDTAPPPAEEFLTLAQAIETCNQLKRFAELNRANKLYFSRQALTQSQLNLDSASMLEPDQRSVDWIGSLSEQTRESLRTETKRLRKQQRCSVLYIAARILLAVCDEILRDPASMLTQTIKLTPMRKAWIYWKSSFRLAF